MTELKQKYQEFRDSCLIYGSSEEIRSQHKEKLISFLKEFASEFYSKGWNDSVDAIWIFDDVFYEIIKELK